MNASGIVQKDIVAMPPSRLRRTLDRKVEAGTLVVQAVGMKMAEGADCRLVVLDEAYLVVLDLVLRVPLLCWGVGGEGSGAGIADEEGVPADTLYAHPRVLARCRTVAGLHGVDLELDGFVAHPAEPAAHHEQASLALHQAAPPDLRRGCLELLLVSSSRISGSRWTTCRRRTLVRPGDRTNEERAASPRGTRWRSQQDVLQVERQGDTPPSALPLSRPARGNAPAVLAVADGAVHNGGDDEALGPWGGRHHYLEDWIFLRPTR